jgi:UDP-N-acetyl-D-glucosamine dehydrogenase
MEKNRMVVVVGLGYVGLPLALLAAERGYEVVGVDIDGGKIAKLQSGESYIDDVSSQAVRESSARFTSDIAAVADAEVVIICVPTPVTEEKLPDLGPLRGAVSAAAPHLKPGVLLAVESTINPGVCDGVLIPLIHSVCDLRVGQDIDFIHCPERINPGDTKWNVRTINRVVGGDSPRALQRGKEFYESLIDAEVMAMGSLKEAEAVKIVENSFRDINIAFVNELAMSFHRLGINLNNVIKGASTKPFAFMPHYPGVGVGGHCIPVDPYYLIEYARDFGFDHQFLSLARSINERMPLFTVNLLEEALKEKGLELAQTKVGLLGLAYKANVSDDRESPSYVVLKLLGDMSAGAQTFDPHIPVKSTASSLEELLANVDALIVATSHQEFRALTPELLQEHGIKALVDGRGMFAEIRPELEAAGIAYRGIGQ